MMKLLPFLDPVQERHPNPNSKTTPIVSTITTAPTISTSDHHHSTTQSQQHTSLQYPTQPTTPTIKPTTKSNLTTKSTPNLNPTNKSNPTIKPTPNPTLNPIPISPATNTATIHKQRKTISSRARASWRQIPYSETM
ncbi:unnamed protein product [Ambrosiozyma monospora]|uniref:Unnamed protein product n=1 Tax=Ambrosiozyma monospora TaxID=43982 RepID=A0ACB5UBG1_AMBMO|nr:unnamed protein product [Ambrosiozyma monospora]